MTITAKTFSVILGILLCILFAGILPSSNTFLLVTIIATVLIVYLIYSVLTDDYVAPQGYIGPSPGYRK